MPDVCFVFYLHHADRLRHVRAFDDGQDFGDYVDEKATAESLRTLARESLLPALRLLRDAAQQGDGGVRVGVVPTGPLLRSARKHNAPLLRAMQQLNETSGVEWVASPADGSILSLFPGDHFAAQLSRQADDLNELFGKRPTTACDTQFLYDNTTAARAAAAGFKAVLCGYADRYLGGRTANQVFRPAGGAKIKVLARHVGLSDDWGTRFGDRDWPCFPLKAEIYADWLAGSLETTGGRVCPIFLHLGDLGRTHEKADGVFTFAKKLFKLLPKRGVNVVAPADVAERSPTPGRLETLDVPQATSGWGPRFDLSPWMGNAMQSNALHRMRQTARRLRHDAGAAGPLARLCAADHLQHMRYGAPGPDAPRDGRRDAVSAEQRRHPSPYESSYEAYLDYTNALGHLAGRAEGTRAAAGSGEVQSAAAS